MKNRFYYILIILIVSVITLQSEPYSSLTDLIDRIPNRTDKFILFQLTTPQKCTKCVMLTNDVSEKIRKSSGKKMLFVCLLQCNRFSDTVYFKNSKDLYDAVIPIKTKLEQIGINSTDEYILVDDKGKIIQKYTNLTLFDKDKFVLDKYLAN